VDRGNGEGGVGDVGVLEEEGEDEVNGQKQLGKN
jgi:hypothetical protein